MLNISTLSPPKTHLFQQALHIFDPSPRPQIAAQKMTLALQTSGQINPVNPALKGAQNQQNIHPARAGNLYHLHIAGITQSHRTCQVRSAVRSMLATKCDNLRLKTVSCSI